MKFFIDDVYTFYVNTHNYEDAAADADSVPAYRVYEEETATPILTGSMALLDSSNTDGFYSEQITLSAANGFEYGKHYCVRIAATINSTVSVQLERFQVASEAEHKIKRSGDLILVGTVNDTDFSPTTTQFEVTGLSDSTANAYKDCYIKVETGDNKHEVKKITASSVVVTNVRLTVETLTAALADGVSVLVF